MATFKTSAILELIDRTGPGARRAQNAFTKLKRSANDFTRGLKDGNEDASRSFRRFVFSQRQAQDKLRDLRRDLRSGKGDFEGLTREIKDTERALKNLNRENRAFRFGNFAGRQARRGLGAARRGIGFGAAGLAGLGVAGFAATNAFAKQADDVAKLSDATGFAIESITALRFALGQTAGDDAVNALPAILKDFNARRGELIRTGAGELSSLNSEFKNILLSAKDTEDAFVRVSAAVRKADLGEAELASTLEKLFGEPGRGLVPFFQKSNEEVNTLVQRAKQFGIVITEDVARNAERFNDRLNDSQSILRGIGTEFFGKLFGPGADIIENRLNPFLLRFKETLSQITVGDIEAAFERVADLLERISGFASGLANNDVLSTLLTGETERERATIRKDQEDRQRFLDQRRADIQASIEPFINQIPQGIASDSVLQQQLAAQQESNRLLREVANKSGGEGFSVDGIRESNFVEVDPGYTFVGRGGLTGQEYAGATGN